VLDDAVRAWAARTFPVVEVPVTRRDIQRFAHATGETDPVHWDEEAARAAGHRDVVAPPLFYLQLRSEPAHLGPRGALAPDGSAAGDVPPLEGARAMAGETEVELSGDIVAGDVVTCRKRLAGVEEKQGRSGPLLLLHWEHRFCVEGATVAVERFTRILR
jgi:hydroxyacyl-ACP dehydratase HTD2-like protein with hotdog domain